MVGYRNDSNEYSVFNGRTSMNCSEKVLRCEVCYLVTLPVRSFVTRPFAFPDPPTGEITASVRVKNSASAEKRPAPSP
jgi:hypothetical protein